MKYLLMTFIVATLLVVPACERRDYKDDPAYNSEGKDAPPSPMNAKDNPTVLADQTALARQILKARADGLGASTSKPASQPAPAKGAGGGFFDDKAVKLPPAAPPAVDSKPVADTQPAPEAATEPAATEPPKEPMVEPTPEAPAATDTPAP